MGRLISVIMIVLLLGQGADAARYAGEAFSLGAGGRAMAMGGAIVAGPFDASAPYWNPAGMNQLEGRSVIAMHAETFGSLLNHDFVAYVDSRPRESSVIESFGFYVYYLGGGGIKITQLNELDRPYVVREESHGDYLFSAAVAGRVSGNVEYGLVAKIICRDLGTESGAGLTVDAGLLYEARSWLNLGLMVSDITTGFIRYSGKTFDSGSNSESIYPTVKPGLSARYVWQDFTGTFAVSGDVKFEDIQTAAQYWSGPVSLDTHFGWELAYKKMLFGRAGFDIGRFTAGGGVDVKRINIDLAYLHHSDLDETFRVSAGYRF